MSKRPCNFPTWTYCDEEIKVSIALEEGLFLAIQLLGRILTNTYKSFSYDPTCRCKVMRFCRQQKEFAWFCNWNLYWLQNYRFNEATCIQAMTVLCSHSFFAQCIYHQLLQFQWLLKVCLLFFISEPCFINMINLTRN